MLWSMAPEWHDHGPVTLPTSHHFTFPSERAGVDLDIQVVLPAMYDSLPGPRPVLYVLDGNLTLLPAAGLQLTYELQAFGLFPSMIVVGIGYAGLAPLQIMSRRMLDLSPTDRLPEGPLAAAGAGATDGMGGAAAFADALRDEVLPEVERRFRADPTDRTIVGWSLGGLFGLHVLFSEPELFRRYVLISPSIWWDDRHILGREEAWAADHDDLAAEVYLAVGDREETSVGRAWPPMPEGIADAARMVSNVHELAARLRRRRYPSFALETAVLTDEHHTTLFPAAVSRALLHLFQDVR